MKYNLTISEEQRQFIETALRNYSPDPALHEEKTLEDLTDLGAMISALPGIVAEDGDHDTVHDFTL